MTINKFMDFTNTRLGYACINTTLQTTKKICCNKTCRLSTIVGTGVNSGYPKGSKEYSKVIYDFLADYGIRNLTAMFKIISWSRKYRVKNNSLTFYRMSSDMFPHISSPHILEHLTKDDWSNYVNLIFARDLISQIGAYAQKYNIRLTMHPDHYNQLGSIDPNVISKTILDLTWAGTLLELMRRAAETYNYYETEKGNRISRNVFNDSILCIHGGGVYGNKSEALERWKANFYKLPYHVQTRIALENDERNYSVEDLLPVCNELQIPLIFDFHHYNCWAYYHPDNPIQSPINVLLPQILSTWEIREMIPKFHLSDQADDKKVGAHHDYVESIPDELITLSQTKYRFDIMIEAKKKELATIKLYNKYSQ